MLKHLDKAHFGNPPKVEIGADGDTVKAIHPAGCDATREVNCHVM